MLDVTVTAHQPLSLGMQPAETAPQESLSYVPGSVLRGALAAAWIRDHGLPTEVTPERRAEFVALFEAGTCYGPLFAEGSAVVPLSVRGCKYRACPGVHVDTAFPNPQDPARCPACDGPLAAGRGEVRFFTGGRRVFERTHLEIDDDRQVAAEGQLFTRRALAHRGADGAERTFHGRITHIEALPGNARSWLVSRRGLRLGGRRGTTGGVSYEVETTSAPTPATATQVALRLQAPAILTDPSGLPLDIADREAVRHALNDELASLLGTQITAKPKLWGRRERVGGWHAASRLPKPTELAVSAGSVLLLTFAQPPRPQVLAALTARGIGLRRNEGFGALQTAVEAWRPPVAETPAPARPREEDPAEEYARLLYGTGEGAWFRKQLRGYVEHRYAGGEPHTDLLGRPQLRRLTQDRHARLTTMLEQAEPAVLDRTLTALAVLIETLGKEERR